MLARRRGFEHRARRKRWRGGHAPSGSRRRTRSRRPRGGPSRASSPSVARSRRPRARRRGGAIRGDTTLGHRRPTTRRRSRSGVRDEIPAADPFRSRRGAGCPRDRGTRTARRARLRRAIRRGHLRCVQRGSAFADDRRRTSAFQPRVARRRRISDPRAARSTRATTNAKPVTTASAKTQPIGSSLERRVVGVERFAAAGASTPGFATPNRGVARSRAPNAGAAAKVGAGGAATASTKKAVCPSETCIAAGGAGAVLGAFGEGRVTTPDGGTTASAGVEAASHFGASAPSVAQGDGAVRAAGCARGPSAHGDGAARATGCARGPSAQGDGAVRATGCARGPSAHGDAAVFATGCTTAASVVDGEGTGRAIGFGIAPIPPKSIVAGGTEPGPGASETGAARPTAAAPPWNIVSARGAGAQTRRGPAIRDRTLRGHRRIHERAGRVGRPCCGGTARMRRSEDRRAIRVQGRGRERPEATLRERACEVVRVRDARRAIEVQTCLDEIGDLAWKVRPVLRQVPRGSVGQPLVDRECASVDGPRASRRASHRANRRRPSARHPAE